MTFSLRVPSTAIPAGGPLRMGQEVGLRDRPVHDVGTSDLLNRRKVPVVSGELGNALMAHGWGDALLDHAARSFAEGHQLGSPFAVDGFGLHPVS